VQLNVRVPITDRDELRQIANASGVSITGLLGAIVHSFLGNHHEDVPEDLLAQARSIDSRRRLRSHLAHLRHYHE
jgi:hypothetical protein